MRSRLLVPGVLALSLAVPALFAQDGPPQSPAGQSAPAHARRPLPKPVNLKVLPKDISTEELRKVMQGFAGSLGVECSFCHAAGSKPHEMDFASDAKPEKASARTMLMMTKTINDQYMSQIHDPDATPEDQHVTCGTCHRGHSMPEHFVPPPEHHHAPQGAPGASPQH
jgi:hypothetical protein